MHANKMDLSFATQLFINGEFVDATSGKKTKLYNPHDESLICEVDVANAADVDKAVRAADKGIFLNFLLNFFFFSFHLENISEILADIFFNLFHFHIFFHQNFTTSIMETKIVTIMYIVFFRKHTIPCHLFTLSIVKKYLIYYKKKYNFLCSFS